MSDPIDGARWRDCKHFRGLQAGTCEAGVNLRELAGGEPSGRATRLPCRGEWRVRPAGATSPCNLFAAPTKEEIEAEEAETEAMIAEAEERFRKLGPVYKQIRRENKGRTVRGETTCPVCGNVLHFRHSGYNGHVWLNCKTDDCVNIIE